MTDLKNTTAIVKHILTTNPYTRNSDSYLYLKVLQHISETTDRDVPLQCMTVEEFLIRQPELPCPAFETVRRTRQKLQATFPILAACEAVEAFRNGNEKEYREYALDEWW